MEELSVWFSSKIMTNIKGSLVYLQRQWWTKSLCCESSSFHRDVFSVVEKKSRWKSHEVKQVGVMCDWSSGRLLLCEDYVVFIWKHTHRCEECVHVRYSISVSVSSKVLHSNKSRDVLLFLVTVIFSAVIFFVIAISKLLYFFLIFVWLAVLLYLGVAVYHYLLILL